jgi:hypothetical protein
MKCKFAGIVALLLFIFFLEGVFSQTLTVSSSQLNFGNVYENDPDSLPLTIYNNMGHAVDVTGIKFYNTYGVPAFSVNANGFSIADGSSYQVWIKFSPRHNILHNSELVIENTGLRGYVSVDLRGQGKYSNLYYASTENLSEENLKTSLHSITGVGYDTLGYNIARDSMFMWLDNKRTNGQGATQNTLESIYTGALAVGYLNRTDCQNNFSFNTEHTFPQSFFSQLEPMRSDLHHLFPTDNLSNNYRSDNPFGVVTNPTWSSGGSSGTTSLFEPRDVQKGATARAMFYFVIRYQNYNGFLTSQESILRTWCQNFPPDQIEKKRNSDIHLIQHNRNPFVDYPQFTERINSISNLSVAPVSPAIDLTEDTMVYGFVLQSVSNIFHYVIVNKGNTTIQLTNFSLSDPGILSFQSGGNDTVISPGDARIVKVNLVTTDMSVVHEFLTFNTNVPAQNSVSIPIYANDSVISGIRGKEINRQAIRVFPNPTSENLFFASSYSAIKSVEVINGLGQQVQTEKYSSSSGLVSLDVKGLAQGIYFLFIRTESGIEKRKFVKE